MLADCMGKKRNEYVSDYCVFDLETTGTSSTNDEVVEISAIRVRGGEPVAEFTTLVNPQRHIPEGASSVNHITDKMVKDAPLFKDALRDFLAFVGDDILVGHNIHTFDMKFICRDAFKYFGKTIGNDYIDTLSLARNLLKGELDSYSLVSLAYYYDVPEDGAHRALFDCRMNQVVFERLGEEMRERPAALEGLKVCPKCGSDMVLRNGKFGQFLGCTGYPNCKYTENVQ